MASAPQILSLVAKFAEWQRWPTVREQLARQSDRELADIGLSRADLPPIYGGLLPLIVLVIAAALLNLGKIYLWLWR